MISLASRRLFVLGLFAGSLTFEVPAASLTTVDFDSYAEGTVITNQYPGVSISLLDAPIAGPKTYTLQDTSGVPQFIFGASGNAIAPAEVGTFAPFYNMQFVFSQPITYFSLMALDAEESVSATAYLGNTFVSSINQGTFIGNNSATVFNGPVYKLELGTVGGSVLFDRVVVAMNLSDGPEVYDNLVFQLADTTPPVLNLPANFAADATSPAGATVTYTATATDIPNPAPTPSCTPPSGLFAIGTTTVNCSAIDGAGLRTDGSFTITVNGAMEQLLKLLSSVGIYSNPWGVTNSLAIKLQNAIDALNAMNQGSASRACNSLRAFINEVQAQSGKHVSEGNYLIESANRIRAVLGCP